MRKKGLAALLLLLSVFFLSCSALADTPGQPSEKTRFDYALTLYNQGACDSAAKEFKALIKDFPKGDYTDDAYYWLGKYYMAGGMLEDGLEQFANILTLLPASDKAAYAQYEIAGYWANPENPKRDLQRAMVEYLKVPYFYPSSNLVDDARYYAALCQLKLGNYAQAEEEFRKFPEKNPDSELAAPALYQLGMAYLFDGKADDALTAFQSVRDKYPAGLYSTNALNAIELITRAKEKRPLSVAASFGARGEGPGGFYKPSGAAIDPEGAVYVSDTGNGRVQRLKAGAGGLNADAADIAMPSIDKALRPVKPSGLALGPKGLLYLTDPGLYRVQAFRQDGKPMFSFGKRGSEAGQFETPAGIAVDEGGNMYVADKGNRRVDKFDAFGRFLKSIGNDPVNGDNALKAPAGVAIDPQGNIVVTDESTDKVFKYGPDGKLLFAFGNSPGHAQFKLDSPSGVCIDAVGTIYVANTDRSTVLVLDRDLKPLTEFPPDGKKVFDTPKGIAVSASGVVYVVDAGADKIFLLK